MVVCRHQPLRVVRFSREVSVAYYADFASALYISMAVVSVQLVLPGRILAEASDTQVVAEKPSRSLLTVPFCEKL